MQLTGCLSPADGLVPKGNVVRAGDLLALPLAIAAMLVSQLLDADFVMMRESANAQAELQATALGAAAAQSVDVIADKAMADLLEAAADPADPISRLRQMIYGSDRGLIVLQRRNGRRTYPPMDNSLAMPRSWDEWQRPLQAAADLQSDGDHVQGWYPGPGGASYFECRRHGARSMRLQRTACGLSACAIPSAG